MMRKLIFFTAIFFLVLVSAYAEYYPSNLPCVDDTYLSTDSGCVALNESRLNESYIPINGTMIVDTLTVNNDLTAGNISGNSTYTHQSYPGSCSDGFCITAQGDANICSRFVKQGGDLWAGNMNAGGNNITELGHIYGNGTFVSIGNGTTNNGLNAGDDLHVGGKFEVDSLAFFNGATKHGDDIFGRWGTSSDVYWGWKTSDTPHTLFLGLGADSNALVVMQRQYFTNNTDHPQQANPTIFIHSITDPDIDDSQWIGLTHNTTDAVISSGTGNIAIDNTVTINGNLTGVDTIISNSPIHCHSYRTTTMTIPNAGAYERISFDTGIDCNHMTTDNENFTFSIAGNYHVDVNLQAEKTTGGNVLMEAVLLNKGIVINGTATQRTVNTNNEVGYFSIDTDIDISAGDVLSVGIVANAANGQLNMSCIVCPEAVTARINIERET